jgi:pyruvate/2-oxoglutarate dehydrogenase complex dihydrolipoamide acyltransferase (E2) component
MAITLKLARLSMNMVEATLVKWHKKPGDKFKQGEHLYDIETEKTTMEVAAEGDGELVQILAEEGAEIEVGAPVCKVKST